MLFVVVLLWWSEKLGHLGSVIMVLPGIKIPWHILAKRYFATFLEAWEFPVSFLLVSRALLK